MFAFGVCERVCVPDCAWDVNACVSVCVCLIVRGMCVEGDVCVCVRVFLLTHPDVCTAFTLSALCVCCIFIAALCVLQLESAAPAFAPRAVV